METELNFIDKIELSEKGLVDTIHVELDIIRICLSTLYENDKTISPVLNRIIVMPLRKLLCEDTVIKRVCTDFRMPPLIGRMVDLGNTLKFIQPPYEVCLEHEWISLNEWRNQKIAWFERTATDHIKTLPKETYLSIINKLNGKEYQKNNYKDAIESMFSEDSINGVYERTNPDSEQETETYYKIIKSIGYDDMTIMEYIKQTSDQTGAHLDKKNTILSMILNEPDLLGMTPSYYFAIQLIIAVKKQIPGLFDYWKEMPNLIEG